MKKMKVVSLNIVEVEKSDFSPSLLKKLKKLYLFKDTSELKEHIYSTELIHDKNLEFPHFFHPSEKKLLHTIMKKCGKNMTEYFRVVTN
jgi:hypothetical protein